MDADKTVTGLGIPVLVALCGGLLGRNTRGGTIVVGALNLGGSIEMIPNAVRIAELAIDKQAQTLLMPVSVRLGLFDDAHAVCSSTGQELGDRPSHLNSPE